ncbi:MAG: SDR family NAD(P)-dependent oxidoreductase, partial [Pseudomonadota bacterium]
MDEATVITGGGRGIGRAIAERMAKVMPVVVVGQTKSDLVSLCEQVKNAGGRATYCVGDVSDITTARRVLDGMTAKNLVVANLVCNAGIAKGGPAHDFSLDMWKRMFEVNVNGSFFFIKTFLPTMMERHKGNICLISSIAGLKGYKYQTAYCATKHALVGMAESLALEYAKYNIQVVPICPSFVYTEMTDRTVSGLMRHRGITKKEALAIVANKNPQKRILPASEVADMVAFV